jgi:hypothetical protein
MQATVLVVDPDAEAMPLHLPVVPMMLKDMSIGFTELDRADD